MRVAGFFACLCLCPANKVVRVFLTDLMFDYSISCHQRRTSLKALPVTWIWHVEDCLLLHLMPESDIHRFAPSAMEGIARIKGWAEASVYIGEHFGASGGSGRG